MNLIITDNYNELSKKSAELIKEQIIHKPNTVLGLATGSSPIGTYKELIRMHKEEGLDFSKVITFNLDEYYGLSPENEQSYHYFMYNNFFKYVNIKPENIHIPDGKTKNVAKFCSKYENDIAEYGGIDIQLLGIGENGHIGFNEPDSALDVPTHLTNLTKNTIEVNARFFKSINEVPKKAVTMGLGTIMRSKQIILIANGDKKADIIGKMINNNVVTTNIPASFLFLHRNVAVIVDKEAAGNLKQQIA